MLLEHLVVSYYSDQRLLSFSFLPEIDVFAGRSSANQDGSLRKSWNVTKCLLYSPEIQRIAVRKHPFGDIHDEFHVKAGVALVPLAVV